MSYAIPSLKPIRDQIDALPVPIGEGQEPVDVSASRNTSTTYQNTTGRPIGLSIAMDAGTGAVQTEVSPDGSAWVKLSGYAYSNAFMIIPDGWFYRCTRDFNDWVEVR